MVALRNAFFPEWWLLLLMQIYETFSNNPPNQNFWCHRTSRSMNVNIAILRFYISYIFKHDNSYLLSTWKDSHFIYLDIVEYDLKIYVLGIMMTFDKRIVLRCMYIIHVFYRVPKALMKAVLFFLSFKTRLKSKDFY